MPQPFPRVVRSPKAAHAPPKANQSVGSIASQLAATPEVRKSGDLHEGTSSRTDGVDPHSDIRDRELDDGANAPAQTGHTARGSRS